MESKSTKLPYKEDVQFLIEQEEMDSTENQLIGFEDKKWDFIEWKSNHKNCNPDNYGEDEDD